MRNYELSQIHYEDFDDFLFKVQDSFGVKFMKNDFAEITTYGEFSDLVISKLDGKQVIDCTNQQSFYKLKDVFSRTLEIDKKLITPDSYLEPFLPRKSRRKVINNIESRLGYNLNILEPKSWITINLIILLIISLISFFYSWEIALSGIVLSLGTLSLATKFGKELNVKTFADLSKKQTQENYKNSRRDNKTYNKKEIEAILNKWFTEDFDLEDEIVQ